VSLEYLAGFFDGEGCITVSKNGSIALGVVNTSKEVLDLFVAELGGVVQDRKQIVNKRQYVWRVYGMDAVKILKVLGPTLIEKKSQAYTAIEWMERRHLFSPLPTGKKGGRVNPERAIAIKKYQTLLTQQKLGIHID
jgi:hypothetical protein